MLILLAHITTAPHLHATDIGLVILGIAAFVAFLVIMAIVASGKE